MVAELLQGSPFLDGTSEIDQVLKMVDRLGHPPSRLYDYNNNDNSNNDNHHHRHHHRYNDEETTTSRRRNNNNRQHQNGSSPLSPSLWDRFDYLSAEGLTLLTRLLEYDPNERWTATQALKSQFFTSSPSPVEDRCMPRTFVGC